MADQSTNGLTYGHVGQLLYNKTDSTWLARRAFGTRCALQPLAQSQWAVKSLGDGSSHDNAPLSDDGLDKVKPGRRVNTQLSDLSKRLPTITPTAALSAPFAHLSEDVTSVTARHDATFGNLLAFGRVADHATKRSFSVAASPARSSPALLCLTQVQHQKQGWEQNKTVWIEVPRIAGEVALRDMTQPIRQLAFSIPPDDPSGLTPYLAVRTPVAVHVLRISLRKHVLAADTTLHSPNRFSIAPSHILHLDLLGRVPPAHVAFNPHYEKQLATIDQSGTWRIWDMSRQPTGHQGKPLEIATGATSDQTLHPDLQQGRVLDDGWGRIAWVGSSTTIISVSRRAIGIYDISNKPIRLPSPDLATANTPHWILDMHTSPAANDIVFILTSVHLVCLRILSVADSLSDDHEKPIAHIVFKITHFRDPEDISLSLLTFLDGDDTVILIRSSLSLIATSYRCSAIQTSTVPFLSVSDPALLTLPEDPSSGQASLPSMGLHVHPTRYAEGYSGASGLGQVYRDSAVRFYMMTTLFSDMSIVEKLYSGQPDPDSYDKILPVDWRSRLTGGAARLQSRRFVVVDDDELQDSSKHAQPSTQTLELKKTSSSSMAHNRKNWTVAYENSYNLITKSERVGAQDFSDVLESVWNNLESQDEPRKGIQTLFDLCESHISVADLDEAAAQFRHLLLEKTERDGGEVDNLSQAMPTILAVASVLGLPEQMDHQHDPMTVYDNIINHWLAPLSQRVPGRVRLAKEQLARRVAAEVCLASCGLKSPAVDTPQEDHQGSDELSQAHSTAFPASSQPQSSFPTPSPTATPSLTTATSLSGHPSTLAAPEYIRLQKYTTFNGTKPTPAPLPKSLSKKLAHWTLGGNPGEYDWLTLQRQQDKEAEEDDEGLTQKQRARLKRRAERHLRKQRKETEKAATMDAASSQAPEIISASQPATVSQPRRAPPHVVAVGAASQGVPLSSSQGVSQSQSRQLFPMSQVESGKFGGREPPKKKRKRVIGF